MAHFFGRLASVAVLMALCASSPVLGDESRQTRYSDVDRAQELIAQGIALHDQGKFVDAVANYEQALLEDPGNIYALYEMTFAYVASGDYEQAHATARRGMGNRSPLVAELYTLSATALDKMGRPEEAVDEFKQALTLFPESHGLNLNLTVTYARLGDFDSARAAAEQTIRVKPTHPSAHLILGQLYAQNQQNVPALMALGRFLTLEPDSRRSGTALNIVTALLQPDFTVGEDGNPVVVMGADDVVDKKKKGTGFRAIAAQLKILAATAGFTQQQSNETAVQNSPTYYGMVTLSSLISGNDNYPEGFAAHYYVPFYQEIEAREFNESFARLALSSLDAAEANEWAQANQEPLRSFTQWSGEYSGVRIRDAEE